MTFAFFDPVGSTAKPNHPDQTKNVWDGCQKTSLGDRHAKRTNNLRQEKSEGIGTGDASEIREPKRQNPRFCQCLYERSSFMLLLSQLFLRQLIGEPSEIAQLRGLDLRGLRARWKIAFRKPALSHLPKHLLFGILAYRLQADAFGDLDQATVAALERTDGAKSRSLVASQLDANDRRQAKPEAGTVLMREWKNREHRIMVMADGFAWKGNTYKSLSALAYAMTGTRWNGPRFFGLRSSTIDKNSRTDR